jgi:predicted ATPase
MARLDRLATVKALAQLGATLGREFSYALLQAVSPWDEETVQRGLHQLVEAEFLFQRGLPPQATYLFKHALIQETAYQSLLRSTRQQYHQRIAEVLAAHFPDTAETQPELLAQHYTEAGLSAQAVVYWQRAGQHAVEHSALVEAINHLSKGLEVLKTLPETPERLQQELHLQTALGPAVMAIKGQGSPEVERVYSRARELCEQVGEPSQLFRILWGLRVVYTQRGDYQAIQGLEEQLLSLAQRLEDPDLLLEAHHALWSSLFIIGGEPASAQPHLEQGRRLYDPQRHRAHAALYSGHDPGVCSRLLAAPSLWLLGYSDQALTSLQAALALAQQLAHPMSLTIARFWAAVLHHLRREAPLTLAYAEATMAIATEQGFPQPFAQATPLRGWALAASGHREEGRAQILQGLIAYRATGAVVYRPYHLALLAEVSAQVEHIAEGLEALAEALVTLDKSWVLWWEAELYRLQGTLLLQQSTSDEHQAETGFQTALAIARRQQAKALELRAATSLSRLWQRQGKRDDARQMLAEVYGWFTEGFDTADLQEAKALLDELR